MSDSTAHAALEHAFERENLLLHYQPIHDARSGAIVAVEALMRQRRENGEIREAHIINEAAEDGSSGDLIALDEWMINTALDDAERWPIKVHVNLSPREFVDGNVASRLSRIEGRRINLEITETQTVEKVEATVRMLHELKKLGFGLWLDDFGSGHSTLEQLLRFPVDGIKIAATFIKELPDDERSAAITRSMIALAHDLGLSVLAEGVEHDAQLQFLVAHDCDFVQGFLFSRPMPREEVDSLFAR